MNIPSATIDILGIHLDAVQLTADSVVFRNEFFHPGPNTLEGYVIEHIVFNQIVQRFTHSIQVEVTGAGGTTVKLHLQLSRQRRNAGYITPRDRGSCISIYVFFTIGIEIGL